MRKYLVFLILAVTAGAVLVGLKVSMASAYSNNNLIDNVVFDSNSMSATQINNWLNGFPNSCISTNNGFTAPDPTGYTPFYPYVDGKYSYGGPVTAGQVIYDAAIAHHINPEVLLTKLQNEEQLVDGSAGCDNWRYTSAVGYACTDSGTNTHNYTYTGADPYASGIASSYSLNDSTHLVTPLYYKNGVAVNSITGSCVNANVKAGFSEQVVHAAWLLTFSRHKAEGETGWAAVGGSWNHCEDNDTCAASFNIPAGWACYSGLMTQGNFKRCPTDSTAVPYDGYATIDGQSIHIDTGATASLYVYTPHFQSFGSIFSSYFGSPNAVNGSIQMASSLSLSPSSAYYVNDSVTASYQVKNTASFDIDAGGLGVCARFNGQNYDFGFVDHQTVPANTTITMSFTKRLTGTGSLNIFSCAYNAAFGWASNTYPYDPSGTLSRSTTVTVNDSPLITSGLILGPANFAINQPVTAYLSLKNYSGTDINIGSLLVAARDPSGNNVDFPIKNDVIIPANTQVDLTWTRSFTIPGGYTFYLAHWNGVWDTTYPHSANGSIIRSVKWPVLDNPLITSGISLSPSNPTKGQAVTATMTVRNVSSSPIDIGSLVIAGRDPNGSNVDFPIENDFTIPAGSTRTYSEQRNFNISGSYKFYLAHWQGQWDTVYPKSLDSTVIRQLTLSIN